MVDFNAIFGKGPVAQISDFVAYLVPCRKPNHNAIDAEWERKIRADERKKMLELINSHIKPGRLQGNGCDDTAQRNGMILAYNLIYELNRNG